MECVEHVEVNKMQMIIILQILGKKVRAFLGSQRDLIDLILHSVLQI